MKIWWLAIALLFLLASPALVAQEEPAPLSAPPSDPAVREALAEASSGTEALSEPVEDIVPGEVFVNANAAYEARDHTQAIELYETLLRHDYENGHLYYNLGNAYLRAGQLGRAIASYRRSQIFLPRDEDLRANLDFARKSAKDALAPPTPGPVLATLFFWHYSLSRAELGAVLVILNVFLWSVLILRIFRQGSEILHWTFIVLLLLVLAVGGSLAVHHMKPEETAVIVPQEIDVRSGTSLQDIVLFKLHAGTEVRVVDYREGSVRIALPDEGQGGWIEAQHAELVIR
jgi:tetratricopeptide (TPR) repeat protein